ncbi:MAG: hydroxyacid dehydrogenase [candidate division Zixibacteria bacterium]|nr:hydroxyacid dehydrogenase [candidate division Zixibacteria bacterium]
MKISLFEVEQWEREKFDDLSGENDISYFKEPLTAENAGEFSDTEIISTFIHSDLDKTTIEKLPDLKMIATRSTGFDHIALDECNEKGVVVCNVPRYGDNTVAEHVFGLLLTISHNLRDAIDRTRKGDFSQEGLQGFDLKGKTIGVIGTGDIGEYVIRIAGGFGMKVLAYDVKPREELAQELGFEYRDNIKDVISGAEIITLHVPANDKTKNMISREEFDAMKDDTILINTSRGSVVNPKDMIEALASGKLKAAGLDVLPEEPVIREEAELLHSAFKEEHDMETLLADHILLRLRNVIVTPHSAFNTCEAVIRILDTTKENIDAFIEGSPENVVNEINKSPVGG